MRPRRPLPASLRRVALAAALLVPTAVVGQETAGGLMSVAPPPEALRTQGLAPTPGHLLDRRRVDLNGAWAFMPDLVERGLRNQRPRYSIPRDDRQQLDGPLVEYDWEVAPTLAVPGDWNSQDSTFLWYEGLAWYRRRLPALPPAPPGERHFLYFEGANYLTHVYLDGEKLAVHEGGFTPFAVEVTGRAREGSSLVVGVSNRRRAGTVPGSDADWWNYGGLTRPVWLVRVPATYVRDLRLALVERDGGARLEGRVALDGAGRAGAEVRVQLPGLGLAQVVRADTAGVATVTLRPPTAGPRALRRWSPESPVLYDVQVTAAGDTVRDRIGFRTIATRGTELLLNGRSLWLRGISIHEEAIGARPGTGGRAVDGDAARRLLLEARALGCNFVRLAHYPHGERMTRLADSLGLLVWSEIPVYQEDIAYESAHTLGVARAMQQANVARDWNRASIIVWAVANETPIHDARLRFLRTLIADVRADDPTRLVSAALNRSAGGSPMEVAITDPLGEHLDLLAYNTYIGWYGALTPDSIPHVRWRTPYAKPLILSEFGADARAGHHGDRRERWTEEYQAWFYAQTLRNADGVPFIRGMSPWILKDFRSPRRYHAVHQQYWNRKGLVSETGRRKQAFDVLARHYARKAAEQGGAARATGAAAGGAAGGAGRR